MGSCCRTFSSGPECPALETRLLVFEKEVLLYFKTEVFFSGAVTKAWRIWALDYHFQRTGTKF